MTSEQTVEAKRLALRWLRIRDYSRQELEQKLAARGFEPSVVRETLGWLEENRWQSDRRMSERLLECLTQEQPSGWRRIQDEFQRRGLSPPDELVGSEQEEARAIQALIYRFGDPPEALTPKLVSQWFQFLLRRGFEPETARCALECWHPRLLDINDSESL
jgi:regulatory protein